MADMGAITPAFGGMAVIIPPERRISVRPGRHRENEKFIRFAFDDGDEKKVDQFVWLDDAHLIYIDGSDILERFGRSFFIIREASALAAHDKLHDVIIPSLGPSEQEDE